jgi:hypothetical protein
MKSILTLALILVTITAAHAGAPAATDALAPKTEKATPVQTPATIVKDATAAATDDLSQYIGTNDFNLALVREGVRKG